MRVSVLSLARDDIRDIHIYLSEFGETQPSKFKESFKKFCVNVSGMPQMYSKYEHNPLYQKAVLIYGYIAFYQVDESGGVVKVHRVLHGKRNVVSLLD